MTVDAKEAIRAHVAEWSSSQPQKTEKKKLKKFLITKNKDQTVVIITTIVQDGNKKASA